MLDVSGAQVLSALLPDAQLDIMPQTGHAPMIERPEVCAEQWLRFTASELPSELPSKKPAQFLRPPVALLTILGNGRKYGPPVAV